MNECHTAVRVGGFTLSVAKMIKVKAAYCKIFHSYNFCLVTAHLKNLKVVLRSANRYHLLES